MGVLVTRRAFSKMAAGLSRSPWTSVMLEDNFVKRWAEAEVGLRVTARI